MRSVLLSRKENIMLASLRASVGKVGAALRSSTQLRRHVASPVLLTSLAVWVESCGREAGFSTSPFTKCVNRFGRNDNFLGLGIHSNGKPPQQLQPQPQRQQQIPPLPCGMTIKKAKAKLDLS
jgi:hypothetical protein